MVPRVALTPNWNGYDHIRLYHALLGLWRYQLQLKNDRQVRPEIRVLLSPVTIKLNLEQ
jgi:hypothetical protein